MSTPRVRTLGGGLNEDGLSQITSGSRAYRPGIDEDEFVDLEEPLLEELGDDDRDTDPDGWVIPEWEE